MIKKRIWGSPLFLIKEDSKNKKMIMKFISITKTGRYKVQLSSGEDRYCGTYDTLSEAREVRDAKVKERELLKRKKEEFKLLNTKVREREIKIKIEPIVTSEVIQYTTNKNLYYEIVVSKAQGKLTDKAFQMLMKIVNGVGKKFFYKDFNDRFDCEGYAIECVIRNWYNFDEEKYDNPFAYYTEIIKRAYAFQWNALEKGRKMSMSYNGLENNI